MVIHGVNRKLCAPPSPIVVLLSSIFPDFFREKKKEKKTALARTKTRVRVLNDTRNVVQRAIFVQRVERYI